MHATAATEEAKEEKSGAAGDGFSASSPCVAGSAGGRRRLQAVPINIADILQQRGHCPSDASLELWRSVPRTLRAQVNMRMLGSADALLPATRPGDGRSVSPSRCLDMLYTEGDTLSGFLDMSNLMTSLFDEIAVRKAVMAHVSKNSWSYRGVTRYAETRCVGRLDSFGQQAPGHMDQTSYGFELDKMHAILYLAAGISLIEAETIKFIMERTTLGRRLKNRAAGGGHFEIWKPGMMYVLTKR